MSGTEIGYAATRSTQREYCLAASYAHPARRTRYLPMRVLGDVRYSHTAYDYLPTRALYHV
eukprot:3622250-Rhodomonas_salina.2